MRGQTLSIREREYVEAARSLGASDLRIMFVDVLPNLVAPVIVYTTLLIPTAIVFEATLSFLGLGVVPPTPTWGNMLADSLQFYQVAWWFVLFPGLALLVTTLAFNLLGDGVRDALDPRHRACPRGELGVRRAAVPRPAAALRRPGPLADQRRGVRAVLRGAARPGAHASPAARPPPRRSRSSGTGSASTNPS